MLSLLICITTLKPMDFEDRDTNIISKEVLTCSFVACGCFDGELKYKACEACNNIMPIFCKNCKKWSSLYREVWIFNRMSEAKAESELAFRELIKSRNWRKKRYFSHDARIILDKYKKDREEIKNLDSFNEIIERYPQAVKNFNAEGSWFKKAKQIWPRLFLKEEI